MTARRWTDAVFGPEPWNVLKWWKAAPPARTTSGTSRSSSPGGQARMGLPAVADLARPVLGVAPGDPVHLVGPDARHVVAREERLEAFAERFDGPFVDEALLDDEESVAAEALELLIAPAVHAQE